MQVLARMKRLRAHLKSSSSREMKAIPPRRESSLPTVLTIHSSALFLSLFIIRLFSAPLLYALEVPPLRGRVNDLAGLMPAERAIALGKRLARFEQETGHQIAVLTVARLEGEDMEGFSIKVAETWKIGKKGFDNGVILLIARDDRKLRIEVGYGLEGVLPDALASRIIREVVVPRFRASDYAGGIEAGVEAIQKTIRGENIPETARPRTGSKNNLFFSTLFILFLPLLMVFMMVLEGRRHARRAGFWSGRGRRPAYWDSGFGGGGSGGEGGFGGGGFSGGGGGFGGGGASGSW